jgi:hypothetical protein
VDGRLAVPELDIHTVSDQLVPVAFENYYRDLVVRAGDARLLKQVYVESVGHCNFTTTQLVDGLHLVQQRVDSGRWSNPPSGDFVAFQPPPFVSVREFSNREYR